MNTDSVFTKTAKGMDEITNRTFGLSKEMRSALIMVDGKASVGKLVERLALIGIKNGIHLLQALDDLKMIARSQVGQSRYSVPSAQANHLKVQDLSVVKKAVGKVIEQYFGFMATPHLNQLARCRNYAEVSAHVAHCQQVIREAFNEHKADEFQRTMAEILS